jgi:hypothetical protein
MSKKLHFEIANGVACGRAVVTGTWVTPKVYRVTCLNCKTTPEFFDAKAEQDAARKAAFEAQEPRQYIEPWRSNTVAMVCSECSGQLFREGDRTCYGHYANYHCAACGHVESRLTETGMSF